MYDFNYRIHTHTHTQTRTVPDTLVFSHVFLFFFLSHRALMLVYQGTFSVSDIETVEQWISEKYEKRAIHVQKDN